MADNVNITAGTGTVVKTDQVGTAHYQVVKLADGTADSETVIAAAGGVEAGALRVTIASDSTGVLSVDDNGGALTVDGTVAVTNAGLTALNGAITGTEVQVDVVTLPAVTGTVTANLSATDNAVLDAIAADTATLAAAVAATHMQVDVLTAPSTVVTDGGGALTVDGTVAVTNADLATIAAAVVGTHVQADVLSMPAVAVTNADVTTLAGAVAGGHMQVDVLSTASHAVTGTVTAELSAIDNAILDTIDAVLDTIDADTSILSGGVSGGHYQVDVLTAPSTPVTNADLTTLAGAVAATHMQCDVLTAPAIVLGAGTAEIGKLAAGTAGIGKLTANSGVDIGDVDVLSIAAGDNNIGNVDVASMPTDTFAADAQAYGKGVLVQGDDGTDRRAILVGTDGHVQVDVLACASHAVTNAGTFATQATLAAETTKVIGTVNVAASQSIAVTQATAGSLNCTEASAAAALTALQVIDNMIAGSEAQVDVVTMPTGASAAQVQGTVAAGSAAAQNPVLNGVKAVNAFPSAVDNADVTPALSDLYGRTIVQSGAPQELVASGVTAAITDTTATQVLAAAGNGLKWYITAITVTNSHATVGTLVTIQDDTGTPVKYWAGFAAALGGGYCITFNPAIGGGQANGKVNALCGTTGSNVYVSVAAYKGV